VKQSLKTPYHPNKRIASYLAMTNTHPVIAFDIKTMKNIGKQSLIKLIKNGNLEVKDSLRK